MSSDPLAIIERRESGGRNIRQQLVPQSVSSASGNFQMIRPTWLRWAKAVGIDTNQYPEAITAPYELQRKAAAHGFEKEGFRPWEATKHLVGQERNYSVAAQPQGVLGSTSAPVAAPITREVLRDTLLREFPSLRLTSENRSASQNQAAGGAKNSQHLHGNAFDVGMRGMAPEQQRAVYERALALGARGIGYYPGSQSAHFDVRSGAPAAWGPNYSRSSLGQTPDWYQGIANKHLAGGYGLVAPSSTPAFNGDAAPTAAPITPPGNLASGFQEGLEQNTLETLAKNMAAGQQQAAPVVQQAAPVAQQPAAGPPPEQTGAADMMVNLLASKRPRGLLNGWGT